MNKFIYLISRIFICLNILILLHNFEINPSVNVLLLENIVFELLIIFSFCLFIIWINFHQFFKICLFYLKSKCILLIFLIFADDAWIYRALCFRFVITVLYLVIEFFLFVSFYFIVVSVYVMFLFFLTFKLTFKILLIILLILLIHVPKSISELFL